MFTVSPWQWPLHSPITFYTYNFAIILFFYFGYLTGIRNNKNIYFSSVNPITIQKVITYSLLLNLIFIYPKFLFHLHVPSASLSYILESIMVGVLTPAVAYATKHESTYTGFLTLSNPLVLSYTLLLPILYLAIPLGILFWKELKPYQKVLFWFTLILDIFSYIAIGTNKGIFDIILIAPWLLISKNPNLYLNNKISYKKIQAFALCMVLLVGGLSYFTLGNQDRKGENFLFESSTKVNADLNAPVLAIIPTPLWDGYLALDSYLTHGYYALGLALEIEHLPTYGLGHSFFLTSLGEKLMGEGAISERTYQAQLDKQFDVSQYGKWHTFYVSMANDLTFTGVLFLVFFIAYFFAQAWIDVIFHKNILAIPVFSLFIIMIFYFPANNQVLQFQASSIVFWTLFVLWRIQRSRFRQ